MTTALVESALRATYHLSGSDSARLRRLTRQAGLDAENVLSRLAIIRSVTTSEEHYGNYEPSTAGRSKEIKGSVLLGRPRQAALILALVVRASRAEFVDLRTELTWHWARGLRLLDDQAVDGDMLHTIALELGSEPGSEPSPARRASRAGLGASVRDELAAAVGRRFPRWSTEVRRMVAMAARLDPDQLDAVVERVAAEADDANGVLSETAALRILRDKWGLNRLGLNGTDRHVLERLLANERVDRDEGSVPFLKALGLVTVNKNGVKLSAMGRRLGQEAIHL